MLTVATCFFLVFILSASAQAHWFQKHFFATLCNTYNPKCGLTHQQSTKKYLSSYASLVSKLSKLKPHPDFPLSVGRLIRHSSGDSGLLDIDVPLDSTLAPAVNTSICGIGTSPTIREAVICTVTNDQSFPNRGNVKKENIGNSTQGRPIMAVRLGSRNPSARRIMFVSQIHGNEAAATEAVLEVLHKLTTWTRYGRKILEKHDILFVVRANPDGGEPTSIAKGGANPPFGAPFTGNSAFFRHNVDPSAGGGFSAPSETDFLGAVGRGYDLNRYVYAGLQAPIRPVEAQTLVAAILKFRPDVIVDMHGDAQKSLCELDPKTISPPNAAGRPLTIKCKPPSTPVPLLRNRKERVLASLFADDIAVLSGDQFAGLLSGELYTRRVRLTRTLMARIARTLRPRIKGNIVRFNQLSASSNSEVGRRFSDGSVDRAGMTLGGVGVGWEAVNFQPEVRPVVGALQFSVVDGKITPVPSTDVDTALFDPCFLKDNICLNERLIRTTLDKLAGMDDSEWGGQLQGDGGWCNVPMNNGIVINLSQQFGFPPAVVTNGSRLIPQGGQLNVPVEVSGKCTGDISI